MTDLKTDLAAGVEALAPNTSARGLTSYNTDGEEKAAIFVAKHHEAVADALCLLETCYGILPRERGPAGEVVREHIAELQARCEALEQDRKRLDYIERTFSGMTNRERYLPVRMIWGKGCNGRTLREACDKYMKRDAAIDASRKGEGNG